MKIAEPYLTEKDIASVLGALKDSQLSGRTDVCRSFEEEYAQRMGVKHAVSVNSGTSSLFLALRAMGISRPSDKVIVPVYAYAAVANAVIHAGATPVFCDVDPETFNIDPDKIELEVGIRAIIAVHTYGHACDMDRILEKAKHVPVIEDAAEAHGATYKGRILGSIGAFGCYSFFANKTITTGEGGMIVTNDDEAYKELVLLKDQYLKPGYRHDSLGWSMCMDGMSCALGRSQLGQLDEFLAKKAEMANNYKEISNLIGEPVVKEYAGHSWWMYAVKRHRALEGFLNENGIETRPGFIPIHQQKQHQVFGQRLRFPVAESLDLMCLPMNLNTGNLEVVKKIKQFFGHSWSK